ncbi:tRNA-splicing endonuclease subunit sen54 N-term-domain-containing protein [Auriculariales sp. MPI-PUGE-AT-0066]|nr:tRNA-splicing endonuclease subunit sen54 N-term-domain-containing protein [Auriculariales sp. MPI-PUGE-AT-0066]
MDDSLAEPGRFQPPSLAAPDAENEEELDEDEDGPDWSSVPAPTSSRAAGFIPKRGEKDFEPRSATGTGAGTGLQQHLLDKSRNAMFTALSGPRGATNRTMSHAVWLPAICRAHVIVTRRKHFATLGTSITRDGHTKRLELLPEESLYLVERGSMFCWKQLSPDDAYPAELQDDSPPPGIPLSVQQAYAEMIGQDGLTLDHYQVYAYLKRLGYNVLRSRPAELSSKPSWWWRLWSRLLHPLRSLCSQFYAAIISPPFWVKSNWWLPRLYQGWFPARDYRTLFSRLQFIPNGHGVPLQQSRQISQSTKQSPYTIFYDVYKPASVFRRTNELRPVPDFQVVVVNARTTPMPTIHELTRLFHDAQEWPAAAPKHSIASSGNKLGNAQPKPSTLPRQKATVSAAGVPTNLSSERIANGAANTAVPALTKTPTAPVAPPWLPLFYNIWPFGHSAPAAPTRRPNPFVALRAGTKSIVIAVVDAGTITCYRFNQGDFASWPMVPS